MTMTKEEVQMLSFQIILHAGNAKSDAMEALILAKKGKFEEAAKKMESADEAFADTIIYKQIFYMMRQMGKQRSFPLF